LIQIASALRSGKGRPVAASFLICRFMELRRASALLLDYAPRPTKPLGASSRAKELSWNTEPK
jgi:hypothetical protein